MVLSGTPRDSLNVIDLLYRQESGRRCPRVRSREGLPTTRLPDAMPGEGRGSLSEPVEGGAVLARVEVEDLVDDPSTSVDAKSRTR